MAASHIGRDGAFSGVFGRHVMVSDTRGCGLAEGVYRGIAFQMPGYGFNEEILPQLQELNATLILGRRFETLFISVRTSEAEILRPTEVEVLPTNGDYSALAARICGNGELKTALAQAIEAQRGQAGDAIERAESPKPGCCAFLALLCPCLCGPATTDADADAYRRARADGTVLRM